MCAIPYQRPMKNIVDKTKEYNIDLYDAFVDCNKAFDSLEIWAITKSLHNSRVDSTYIKLVENIHKEATCTVNLHNKTEKIHISRGIIQGDAISTKLFSLAMEDIFKELK